MLLMLLRFFAHTDETEAELEALSRGTLRLMASVLRPLGEALTKMPAGDAYPGRTAGPGFGYNRDVHLLPHKESAWMFFAERLEQLATKATCMRVNFDGAAGDRGGRGGAAGRREPHRARSRKRGDAAEPRALAALEHALGTTIAPELNGPYLVTNLRRMTNSKGETLATRTEMALCRCGGSRDEAVLRRHARARSGSQREAGRPHAGPARRRTPGSEMTVYDNRGTCCHSGNCTDNLPAVFTSGEPFVDPNGAPREAIIDIVRACPSGALGYARRRRRVPRPATARRTIYVSKDGPYHVRGGIALRQASSSTKARRRSTTRCAAAASRRTSRSATASHWYVKFADEKN